MATSGRLTFMPIPNNQNFMLIVDWRVSYLTPAPYATSGWTGTITMTSYLRTNDYTSQSFPISSSLTGRAGSLNWVTIPNDNPNNVVGPGSVYKDFYLEQYSNTYTLTKQAGSDTVYEALTVACYCGAGLGSGNSGVKYNNLTYNLVINNNIVIDSLDTAPRKNIVLSVPTVTETSATITASIMTTALRYWQYSIDDGEWVYFNSDPSLSTISVSKTVTGLTPGETYSIKVRGIGPDYVTYEPTVSSPTTFTTTGYVTPVVTLSLVSQTPNTVTITATSNVECYNWKYYLDNVGNVFDFTYSESGLSATQIITDLSLGSTYDIWVTAESVASGVESANSNTITVNTNDVTDFVTTSYSVPISANVSFSMNVSVRNNTNKHSLFLKYVSAGQTAQKEVFSGRTLTTGNNTVQLGSDVINWITQILGSEDSEDFGLSLTTYDSNDTWIGVDETATLTIYVDSGDAPTFTDFVYDDTNPVTVALTGNSKQLIQNNSTIQITVQGASAVSPATIVSYSAAYGETVVTGNTSSLYIQKVLDYGTLPLTVTVTDSYGRSATLTKNVTSSPYSKITLSPLIIARDPSTNVVNASITGSYESVIINNVEKNSLQEFYYEYRASDTTIWTRGSSISPTISDTDFSISNAPLDTMAEGSSWYVRFTAKDKLTTYTSTALLAPSTPLLSFRESGIGIHNTNPNAALDVIGLIEMNGFNVEGFVGVVTDVVQSGDLNDLLGTGIYVAETDQSYSAHHYPSNCRGIIEILPESQGLVQRFTKVPADGTMWLRHYNSTNQTFGQWAQIAGEGTFSQVNSDWNETDPTNKAFILNKDTVYTAINAKAPYLSGSYYVPGQNSVVGASYKSSAWYGTSNELPSPTVVDGVPHYTEGLTIKYKIDVAGQASYGTVLRLNGEDYEHPVIANVNTLIGTRYPVDCIVTMIYDPTYDSSLVGTGQYYYMPCAKNALGASTTNPTVDGATLAGHTTWVKGDCVTYNDGTGNRKYVLIRHENIGANWVVAYATSVAGTLTSTYARYFLKGAWKVADYDANTNTIGYQLRTNSSTLPAQAGFYRYRLLFTSADGTKWVPSNTSNLTNATGQRDVNQTPIDPFGEIVYYGTTAAIAADALVTAAYLWQQYTLVLGYSFNRTGEALVLTFPAPIYIKAAPQSNGSAIIDADDPYVQTLPSTEDGKIYIYLGRAYSADSIELTMKHPIYYYKDGLVRPWTNQTASGVIPSAYMNTNSLVSAKEASCTNFTLKDNSYLHINVTIPNFAPGALTLNVNGTGAKPIYINGEASSGANMTLPAGTYLVHYDGTNYQFRTDGTLPGNILSANQVPWTGIQNRPTLSHVSATLVQGTASTYAITVETR